MYFYLDGNCYVLPEVWTIIDTKVKNQNKEILCKTFKLFEGLNPISCKMFCVPWDLLKNKLVSLNEQEVIKEIQETTYITQGIIL